MLSRGAEGALIFSIELADGRVRRLADKALLDPPAYSESADYGV
jgi:hypothetical protein